MYERGEMIVSTFPKPEDVRRIADEKGYIIMAHNYQIEELQQIADFVGDSLQLARQAIKVKTDKILFLGVDFMADMIKALNMDKKVIVPVKGSTCPMANCLRREDVLRFKDMYNAPVVAYVNSSAEVKAVADIICTSANAVDVVSALDTDVVLFCPDKNLASYVAEVTGKKVIPIPGDSGYCYVHNYVTDEEILELLNKYRQAEVMAHPEVPSSIRKYANFVGSTSQMEKYPSTSNAKEFIVVTEKGMIAKLKKLYPDRTFIPVHSMNCYNMKKNNLKNTLSALIEEKYEVELPEELSGDIKRVVERMLEITEKPVQH